GQPSGAGTGTPSTESSGSDTGDHRLPARVGGTALVVQAAGRTAAAELEQRDGRKGAVVLREKAARMEAAAGRQGGEVGRRAGDRGEVLANELEVRHGPQ